MVFSHRSVQQTIVIGILLAAVISTDVATAQVIVGESFDSYISGGTPDQAAFLTNWPTDDGCGAALISNAANRQNSLPFSLEERRGGTGTRLVKDIQVGTGSSNPNSIAFFGGIGGRIVFAADDGNSGAELWRAIHGLYPRVEPVLDIRPGPTGSSPASLTTVGTAAYFTADDGTNGVELWRTNGNAGGTLMVANLGTNPAGSSPAHLTAYTTGSGAATVNTCFFTADDGVTGRELWKDSTGAVTEMLQVKDINLGGSGSDPADLVVSGGALYFTADDGSNGREVWKTQGADINTIILKDIVVGPGSSSPANLVNVSNVLFFTADDGVSGNEVWRSDGTETNTVVLKDIVAGPGGSSPDNLVNAGGTLFFTADDGVNGNELWKSNATEAGTVLVKDIVAGPGGSNLTSLVAAGTRVYFVFDDGTNGAELWVSDGTEAGTMMIENINPGPASSAPASLAALGNALYFSADDGSSGRELWRSNGTPDGTYRVHDINPGPASSSPTAMGNYDGAGFFAANDGTDGVELWQTDGNAAPAVLGSNNRRDLVPIIQSMDASKSAVMGTDASPLVFRFGLDMPSLGTDFFSLAGQVNRYVELNDGVDAAPVVLSNVDCEPGSGILRPKADFTDGQVHRALAVGVLAVLDQDPCDTDPAAGIYAAVPFVGKVAVFDGLQWHVASNGSFGLTQDTRVARRFNWCTVTIKSTTIDVVWDCRQCSGGTIFTFSVPRQYLGGFRAMELGNSSCVSSPYESYIEDATLSNGVLSATLEPVGACCLADSSCLDGVSGDECLNTHAGSYRGVGSVCESLSVPCCSIPYADTDGDADVDSTDFAAFQRCVTTGGGGLLAGCECFDRNSDLNVDAADLLEFESCQSGPGVPVADPTDCDAYP